MPDLLSLLDSASHAERLQLYERSDQVLTDEEVVQALASQRRCRFWLVLRYEAGAPGTALPDYREARERLREGRADKKDIVALVLTPDALREESEDLLALLTRMMEVATVSRASRLAGWLVEAAVIASLVLGRPEQGWALLDAIGTEGYEPGPVKVAHYYVDALRADPVLARSGWVRLAADLIWLKLDVPALRALPISRELPRTEAGEIEDPRPIIERLKQLGAVSVCRSLVNLVSIILGKVQDEDAREPDDADALRKWRQLCARVLDITQRVGDARSASSAAVEQALSGEPALALSKDFLVVAAGQVSMLAPLSRWVTCALLLQWTKGSEFEDPFWSIFAYAAVGTLYELGRADLFPARLRLLDALIEKNTPGISQVDLLLWRANTRLALAGSDAAQHELGFQDLREAELLSQKAGDVEEEVRVACARAHAETLGVHGLEARKSQLLEDAANRLNSLLPRAEAAGIAVPVYEVLAEIETQRAQRGHSGAGAKALHYARRVVVAGDANLRHPTNNKARLAELLLLHGAEEERPEAIRLAREALKELPADAGELHAAMPHFVLGSALVRSGAVAEGLGHLEQALALQVRLAVAPARVLARIALAEAYLEQGRRADARHQLERAAAEARAIDDHAGISDAAQLLARLDREGRLDDMADARLQGAEEIVTGTAREPLLALERLRPRSHGEELSEELIALMRRYIGGKVPRSAEADALLLQIVANHAHQLPADLQARFLMEDEQASQDPAIRARLLLAQGHEAEALALLRQTLSTTGDASDRLNAAALLVVLLPRDAHEERLEACEVLEDSLGESEEYAPLRNDLAEGLRLCGRNDPGLLARARRHADLAARQLQNDPGAVVVNTRVRASIRADLLVRGAAQSTPAVIELASWFEAGLRLPSDEVAARREHAAKILLVPGPLAHPKALEVASRLIDQVPDSEAARGLKERLRWVHVRIAAAVGAQPPDEAETPLARNPSAEGPFDDVPTWAVALAQGQKPRPDSVPERDRETLFLLLSVRPDRADALIEFLLEQEPLTESEGDELLSDLAAMSKRGSVTAEMLRTVDEVAARRASFPVLRLSVLLHSQTRVWGDGTPYAQAADRLVAAARTPEERVEAGFLKGVERMNALQRHRIPDATGRAMAEAARRHLFDALEMARGLSLRKGRLFALMVSAGNSCRKGAAPDVERALSLYREAEALGAPNEAEAAKLWKVMANGLLDRKSPGDAEQALALLERSLQIRREGYLRVETLIAAAGAEMVQPGREEVSRLRRALSRIDEAVLHDDGMNRESLAKAQLHYLGLLVQLTPKDPELHARLEELSQSFPTLTKAASRAKHGWVGPAPKDMVEPIQALLRHPAGRALLQALMPLRGLDPDLSEEPDLGDDSRIEAAAKKQGDRQQEQAAPSLQELRAHADQLASVGDPVALPGAAVGRARLLAYLAEYGVVSAEEARRVVEEAEQHVRRMEDQIMRRYLLLELGRLWAPENHVSHPVRDFRRSAMLAREVFEAVPPGDALAREALQGLARATRYRTDGDARAHRLEAERLYEQCAQAYEAVGMTGGAARVRVNLAEVQEELHPDGTERPLRQGLAAARVLLAEVSSPQKRADAQATLAYYLTSLGADLPAPEGESMLAEAKGLYEQLEWAQFVPAKRVSVGNYQTICLAEIARRAGRQGEAIEIWRKRLSQVDRSKHPMEWGYTIHNLVDMMLRAPTEAQLVEGLELADQALEVRTLALNPRHHWETCWLIGRTVAGLLAQWPEGRPWRFPFSVKQLWKRGLSALQGAGEAARHLDGGDRLMQVASQLFQLAMFAPPPEDFEQTAELAWRMLDEARPYLLLDEKAGAEEADWGAEVAVRLASVLSQSGIIGVSDGAIACLLSGERAERVVKWMARTLGAAQRRLAGRTAQPATVPHERWVEWLSAIQGGDSRTIALVLEQIRQSEPAFLRGEPDLTGTWNWLQAHPGSTAVAVLEISGRWLAAILEYDGRPRVHVAALEIELPPCDEETLAAGLDANGGGEVYSQLLSWARQSITVPLQRLFSRPPTHMLWVPTGVFRALAPADLWPSSPVTSAVRLDLETRWHPRRPRRTLVAVADPGPDCHEAQEIPGAIEAGARLARLAEQVGPVRVRMGRGRVFGEALGHACPGLEPGPVSPEDILRELAEVDVALILCHGEVAGPSEARLLLLDESGAIASLNLERIAEDPRRLAGMLVVLLSCEAGRVGDWLHRAAGFSGALLACGARGVVAPLWPVRIDPAVAVGEAILRALSTTGDLSVVLHHLRAPEGGAVLGGRVGLLERERERAWSLKAFVHWTA